MKEIDKVIVDVKSLKNYESNLKPYYAKEIVPYVVERTIFKPSDVGRLGKSASNLGMGKIQTKTPMAKYMVDFLNKSTIHGLNHIAAPHRHFVER